MRPVVRHLQRPTTSLRKCTGTCSKISCVPPGGKSRRLTSLLRQQLRCQLLFTHSIWPTPPLSLLNIVEQCRRVSNSVSQYQPSTKKAGPTKKTVYVAEIFGKMSRNAISFSKGYCGIPVNYFHWRRRDETLG